MSALADDEWNRAWGAVYPAVYSHAVISHGYATAGELTSLRVSPAMLDEALARNALARVRDGVYRLTVFRPHPLERLIAAWLDVGRGTSVSHQAALAARDLAPLPDVIDVTVRPGSQAHEDARPVDGVRLHVAELSDQDRGYAGPVRATGVARALADCAAAGVASEIVEAARARAVRKKLIPAAPSAQPARAPEMDPGLRVALASALLPAGEVAQRAGSMDAERLRVWASSQTLAERDGAPLTELFWNEGSLLWPAAGAPIARLDGLEPFSALTRLVLRGSRVESLAPIASLEELVAAEVGVAPGCDLAPLRACGRLRRVRIVGAPSPEQLRVAEDLRAAGVIVDFPTVRAAPDTAPFADPMLKLAVLDRLAADGRIELPDLVTIDEFELDRENLDRLLALEIPPGVIETIEALQWASGGHEIQHRVWPQWDGEGDDFVVHTLGGIEALPVLRELSISSLGAADPAEVGALRARGVRVVDADGASE